MSYVLLTGATGLVGGYLLRYLLGEQQRVAVLVRSTRLATAAARIDSVMRRWEEIEQISLPRPVVIEGDLCEPALGVDASDRRWLTNNCDSMLHNAASMTFREDKKTGEPFRTNVEGVKNILALCRQCGIRQFHHISTAYVCGLRTGLVRETELDLGQENGNVYERSKLTGEKLVLAESSFEKVTIYRPASVAGDSKTGFTTSTHGFYLPLQLAYVIADKVPVQLMGDRFFKLLGLRGDEGKNLVPVDWLAQAIVAILTQARHHGRTYHMTSPTPVTVQMIQAVIQESIEKYSTRRSDRTVSEEELAGIEALFRQYMDIYRSHWRDDPKFDRTNTNQVLPQLPCPQIDHEMLLRIAAYPVQRNFVLSASIAPQKPQTAQNYFNHLAQSTPESSASAAADQTVGVQINGDGGGQWRLTLRDGRLVAADVGLGPGDAGSIYLNDHTFTQLHQQLSTVDGSVNAGRMVIQGGRLSPDVVVGAVRDVFSPNIGSNTSLPS
jgi:thioester reductase-like protein